MVGLLLLCGFAFASGQTADSARITIASTIDANWRGAYDILVRPSGSRLDLERTNGLVEPNFLGFSGQGGISLNQLASIRAISGVGLAAPVSIVGYLRSTETAMAVYRRPPPDKPTLYRVEMTLRTSDGLSPMVLDHQTADLLIGPGADIGDLASVGFVGLGSGGYPDGSREIDATFRPQFVIQTPLLAVDPVAEGALLGPSAGFLDQFAKITDRADLTVGSFDTSLIPDSYAVLKLLEFEANAFDRDRPAIPVVVSRRLYAPLTVDLHVVQVGKPIAAYPPQDKTPGERIAAARLAAGPGTTDLGIVSRDVTADLRPFLPPDLTVAWPGSVDRQAGGDVDTPRDYRSVLVGRPDYGALLSADVTPTFSLDPLGVVRADGTFFERGTAAATAADQLPGTEPAYRQIHAAPLAVSETFKPTGPYDRPFHFAPIGEFDLGDLQLPDNPLDYVALGAYDPPDTQLIKGPDGTTLPAPVHLTPTLQPAGLIHVPPLAITDLAAAELLRGPTPIDAIRVRVAGITGYDPASRALVERVATAIAGLGLDVDIVAGSSPQPVNVQVAGYHLGTDPPGALGTIRQGWTTLGVAERIDTGLGSANVLLLGMALATGLVFVFGLGLMALATRRREAAILAMVGWTRLEIARWLATEGLAAGTVIAVLAVAGWFIGGRSPVGLAVGLAFAAMFPAINSLMALVVLRRLGQISVEAGDAWLGGRPTPRAVRGLRDYGVRSITMRPLRGITVVAGLGLAAAAVSFGSLIVADTARRVGPTLLAGALGQVLRPYQLALLGLTAVAGVSLTLVLLQLDRRDRRAEFLVLAAVGWTSASIRRSLLVARIAMAVPAAILAAVVAVVAAGAIAPVDPRRCAVIAALLAASVVVWGRPWRWSAAPLS